MKTYSFQDVSLTITHPSVGKYVANGDGLGNINITFASDRTAHEVAADGSVMVSKIRTRNGTMQIAAQQTSNLHAWLLKLFNYLDSAPTSEWAQTQIVIRCPNMGETITGTGVSPQKLPDRPYQAQGQNVTWSLMCADIQEDAA